MQSQRDLIDYLNLGFTFITTLCALYLAYVALQHSAKPRIKIRLLNRSELLCGNEIIFKFKISNIGYWYAKPIAVNLVVYCNFDKQFDLRKMFYGSVQQLKDDFIKKGVGNMNYFKATGLKVGPGKEGEEIHILSETPEKPGKYHIRVDAYSENGASYRNDFSITCYLNTK